MKKITLTLMAALALVFTVAAAQCAATTKKGKQCKRQAAPDSIYCWQHKK